MRIVHFIDELEPGGVTSVILDLAEGQVAAGHSVRIASLKASGWDERVQDSVELLHGYPSAIRAIGQADIVHCHQRRTGLLSVAAGAGPRTVEHVHNVVSGRRSLSYRGAAVVAVSRTVASHLEAEFPRTRGRVKVIENAVRTPAFPLHSVRRERTDAPRLLGVGRLELQKDPIYFLSIVAALRSRMPALTATWIGEGSLEAELLKARAGLGLNEIVALSGWLPRAQLHAVIASHDALLITSRWEGLPVVAVEALACGLPVATTRCGDFADSIADAGAGTILPFDEAAESAQAIAQLLSVERAQQQQERARQLHQERYSMGRAIREWDALYRRLTHVEEGGL